MAHMTALQSERKYLLDLLRGLKPAQWHNQTLCEGWDIADLVAHLIVRERGGLLARLGIFVPAFAGHTTRAMAKVKQTGPEAMIQRLARGPWWTTHLSFNLLEHYIHNEDILRSQLHRQRQISPQVEAALSKLAPTVARVQLPHSQPLKVVMQQVGDDHIFQVGTGTPNLTLTARPGELLLLAQGRGRVAKFTLDGPAERQKQFRIDSQAGV